jgi:nitroreductase
MDALTLLTTRNSQSLLTQPAPDSDALEQMFRAALRAPDHGRLQPWRFLLVQGDARDRLGELFAEALLARKPDAGADEIAKARKAPLRAPLLIVTIAQLREHKVPRIEQLLATGCAAHGLLLAAHALGYGAIWRTGDNSSDPRVRQGLELAANEEIVGFIYVGTPSGRAKTLPEVRTETFVRNWE